MPELQSIKMLLRAGRLLEAQNLLREVKTRRLSREDRLETAYLAREAGLDERALEVLHPVIRPGGRATAVSPTLEEKGEYALALVHVGLGEEAKTLFKGGALAMHPRASIALGFAHFRDWDFETAARIVDDALRSKAAMRSSERFELKLDSALYRLHGQTSRYAPGADFSGFRASLVELNRELKSGAYSIVRLFTLFGIAISYLYERRWADCIRELAEVEAFYRSRRLPFQAPVLELWRSLAELGQALEAGAPTRPVQSRLGSLRSEFIRHGLASYARSADIDPAFLLKDRAALERAYFSCPLAGAHRQIEDFMARLGHVLPESHDRREGPAGTARARKPPVFDLRDPECARSLGLRRGDLPHRIFVALASDVYTRPSLASLFGLIFPDEFYNPNSSPGKVEQGLFRLRRALKQAEAPFRVEQEEGRFFLVATGPLALRVHKTGSVPTLRQELETAFGARVFTASEAARALGVSAGVASARLSKGFEEGWLSRLGVGRATRYRLKPG